MLESVQNYYGKVLQHSNDLKTSACCDVSSMPDWLKPLLAKLHPQVTERYYGCGLVAPAVLEGARVLDLGSGSGRDCYLLAQLVGSQGQVVGVDMTVEQLAVANAHLQYHAEQFGFANVEFRQGYIENLDALGLSDASFDVIVSNCVINLSPDKDSVLREAYRLLKKGGELYFSDIYADRRLPAALREDELLYGECLGGALFDSLTVAGNVAFPLRELGMKNEREIAARVAEALEIVHLPGEQNKLPPDLSGGMRKRVALARAIVHRPACVLFDEPHTGLDPVNAASIDHLIRELRRDHGVTNIVITHELRSVFRIADRAAFIHEGVIHWSGTPDELRATQNPVLRAFLEGETGEAWD